MALQERKICGKVEVICEVYNAIQLKEWNIIERDGVEIARNPFRTSYYPGRLNGSTYERTELHAAPLEVRQVAGAVWTNDIHTQYEAYLRAQ